MVAKDEVGRYGEDVAARHLIDKGYAILARNWRCDLGEVDIVARDGDCLVICEVKTRRSDRYGTPQEAVNRAKVERLRRLTGRWLAESGQHPRQVRIDVVAVLPQRRGPAVVEHVQAVA